MLRPGAPGNKEPTPHMIAGKPSTWGPAFWKSLHSVASQVSKNPSEAERTGLVAFFESLRFALPCNMCKHDYFNILAKHPVHPYTASKELLSEWVWRLHNTVNQKLDKPLYPFSIITALYGIDPPADLDPTDLILQVPLVQTQIDRIPLSNNIKPSFLQTKTYQATTTTLVLAQS